MATNAKETTRVQIPAQPRLPSSTPVYDAVATDQTNNILRLFFNQIVGAFSALFGKDTSNQYTGGRFVSFPYGAVQRTTDKTFTANTATQVTFDQTDFVNGMANVSGDGIQVTYSGVYNYQFSVQLANTDTQIHTAYIWLRVYNGTTTTDIEGTGSKFDVPNSHGGVDGYLIAACNFYVELNAGDHVELWAAVSQAYVPATSDGVYMEAYTAQTSPFVMPAIPSVVATLTFVSPIPT